MTGRSRILRQRVAIAALASFACASPATKPTSEAPTVDQGNASPQIAFLLIPADVTPPVVEWSDPVDFGELRILYGRRRDFGARCEHPPEREQAFAAMRAQDADKILELTESLLARCPVDPLLHYWRATALASMGLEDEAEVHRRWVLGLFDSILATGDGKTMKTPFVTISIYEEYELLSYLGLTSKQQALVGGDVALDRIVAARQDGSEVTLYFDPALHFLRLYDSLE